MRRRSNCPLSLALELIGDPWSLLIVRDAMLRGTHTFAGFMDAGEKISSSTLTARLERLQRARLIVPMPNDYDRRRFAYHLSLTGADLMPVVVELAAWAARHFETDEPASMVTDRRRGSQYVHERFRARFTKP